MIMIIGVECYVVVVWGCMEKWWGFIVILIVIYFVIIICVIGYEEVIEKRLIID